MSEAKNPFLEAILTKSNEIPEPEIAEVNYEPDWESIENYWNRGEINNKKKNKFSLIPWQDIIRPGKTGWTIKKILPSEGLAALFGPPGSYKTMLAVHMAGCIASGSMWGDRKVTQGPVVYIASEAAAGVCKRFAGLATINPNLTSELPIALITQAPNFGSGKSDLQELISAIQSLYDQPQAIFLDTLSQSLGGSDENSSGMLSFVANATALSSHFKSLVIIIHHTGLSNEQRLRGHSSLLGALDVSILCRRQPELFQAVMTLQKSKDEASNISFRADLSKVSLGIDEDGEDISTLVVSLISQENQPFVAAPPRRVPPQQRLLNEVVLHAIEEEGVSFRPFGFDGPIVNGVSESRARRRYYDRLAEQAAPDEDHKKLASRQQKAFSRAINAMANSKRIITGNHNGERFLWFP